MRLLASLNEYREYLSAAEIYWSTNTPPAGGGWIITEALHQDIRVTLRNLTIANSIRRIEPARVLVLTGTDDDWFTALFQAFDTTHVRSLCEAFGAEMLNLHHVVDARLGAGEEGRPALVVGGRELPPVPSGIGPDVLDATVSATFCRVKQVPRVPEPPGTDPEYVRLHRRSQEMSGLYDDLMAALRPVAFITSHVDYNQWGLAVESATRHGIPVIHTQSTGSLKAYTVFPENSTGASTLRGELTNQIGGYFEQHVWPKRAVLHRSAELVAWRSKANLGRPSWWRAGATASATIANLQEREQVRAHALGRFEFDPALPVVVVFNHAISDALGTNHEAFSDLATWFERTAAFAAVDSGAKANWLMLDHPSQGLYDSTGYFSALAHEYASAPRMAFRPSVAVPKNLLWSLADLGVTVRGSVSNELPAYGIPVIQAGWSEWSKCGLSLVADDVEAYEALLSTSIDALHRGDSLITGEQVERARLWLWFYRSGTDVVSTLVPAWDEGDGNPFLRSLRLYMRAVESDAEPVFAAVQRMWERRDPFLTRLDLTSDESVRRAFPRALVL